MVETAGTKLRRARTQRHLSLADAARATKIRASQLTDLENDDYSNFANLAYARGFLVSYGKYLQLDVRPYMDAFADASTFGLDDYQYLRDVPIAEYRARTRPWRKKRRSSWKQVAALVASFVVLAVGVFSFYLYVNFKRLGGDLGTLVERQSAPSASESTAANGSAPSAPGDASKPAMVPVSSTPVPSASAPPATAPTAPAVAPNPEENRTAAAALALAGQNNSPAALLTSLAMPAVKPPGEANAPSASPTPGKDGSLFVHTADKSVDAYRVEAAKPQKVSNDSRH